MLIACLIAGSGFVAACGGSSSSPAAPSTQTTTQTQATVSLAGTVSAAGSGAGLSGAVVTAEDGANQGTSATTDSSGHYQFSGLTKGNENFTVAACGYGSSAAGTYVDGVNTLNFSLSSAALWTHSGSGDNVFDMPASVSRVRIEATYQQYSSNFIVHIAGAHIVNELIGTAWGTTSFSGTYQTSGGTVEIVDSSGVSWTFTQVCP